MLYVVHLVLLVSMNCPYLERREEKKTKTKPLPLPLKSTTTFVLWA
jgi:hypothetical protein